MLLGMKVYIVWEGCSRNRMRSNIRVMMDWNMDALIIGCIQA